MSVAGPIGVFDSGYGGLTVLRSLVDRLPSYDYLYLGDNARAPYGNRSFSTIHQYTLQAVKWFFKQGCPLVILACNTASAKALRTIQQKDLPRMAPDNRVLGVIRPTAEVVGHQTQSGHVGILATPGTVQSESYVLEMAKFFPKVAVHQQACPLWVPLIEQGEHLGPGSDYFIQKDLKALLEQSPQTDLILLACTHYPLMEQKIREHLPAEKKLLTQGSIVAESLADYLNRHPEMETRLRRGGSVSFFTTDETADFDQKGAVFYGQQVQSTHLPSDELIH
ncbi:MAG: glutamate racemase [Bacteroidetes bacterium]|nr:glutamate racemase [Bacteroidota bacterium]